MLIHTFSSTEVLWVNRGVQDPIPQTVTVTVKHSRTHTHTHTHTSHSGPVNSVQPVTFKLCYCSGVSPCMPSIFRPQAAPLSCVIVQECLLVCRASLGHRLHL